MKKERWFKCFPGKWLAALGGMSTEQSLLYIIVCFRVYDLDGPCPDTIETLRLRTGLTRYMTKKALDALVRMGKLYAVEGGWMNSVVAELLDERTRFSKKQSAVIKKRWQKHEQNQQNVDTNVIPSVSTIYTSSTDSQSGKDSKQERLFPTESPTSTESHSARGRKRSARIPMPEDWEPSERDIADALDIGIAASKVRQLVAACRDYHLKHGTLIAGSIGLSATWRTWCRNEIKFNDRSGSNGLGRARPLQDDSKS